MKLTTRQLTLCAVLTAMALALSHIKRIGISNCILE